MTDDETIDLIVILFARHVPDSLDKRLVLERLNKSLWTPPAEKCRECGKLLTCLDCEDISVSTDVGVTLRIGNRIIHLNP